MKNLFFYILAAAVLYVLINLMMENLWAINQAKGLIENYFMDISLMFN